MFKDNIASWTWPGYEGKPAIVDVYSDAQEVELFLNGKSLEKKQQEKKMVSLQHMKYSMSQENY